MGTGDLLSVTTEDGVELVGIPRAPLCAAYLTNCAPEILVVAKKVRSVAMA